MSDFRPLDIVSINVFCPYHHMFKCKTYLVLHVDNFGWNVMFMDAIPAASFGLMAEMVTTPVPYLSLIERL